MFRYNNFMYIKGKKLKIIHSIYMFCHVGPGTVNGQQWNVGNDP